MACKTSLLLMNLGPRFLPIRRHLDQAFLSEIVFLSVSPTVSNISIFWGLKAWEGSGDLGGPIPKSWAKAWGYRVASAGGKTKFTGVPSLIAQRRKMPSGNWLRNICKYANKAWFAYGGYLVVGELWCLSTCDERHPGCEEIKRCEGMNP